jgi:hypothetical protein
MKRIEQPLEINRVEEHRREDCAHYMGCLEEASTLLWPSFSCLGCRFFACGGRPALSYERAASPLAWDC